MAFSIKLAWSNPNAINTITNIYRSINPIDRANLGAPYKVLSNGEVSFTDTNVVYGQEYNYAFESVNGADRVVSRVFKFSTLPYTGPGPQELLLGDVEYGYYGKLTPIEFIAADALIAKLGIAASPNSNQNLVWHKYSYKGKILYVPETSISNTVAWNTIYAAGCMYGVEGEGPLGGGVPQNATVTFDNNSFKVRSPTGLSPSAVNNGRIAATWDGNNQYDMRFSESDFDLFFMPITGYFNTDYRLPRVRYSNVGELMVQSAVICQETMNTSDANYVARVAGARGNLGKAASTAKTTTSANRWYPILEWLK